MTETLPNFIRAISERMQGKDRTWDVIFTGVMLEADIAGTYAIARPTGIAERINAELGRRIPSLRPPTLLELHYGTELPGHARSSFAGWQAQHTGFGPGVQLVRFHSPVVEGGNPYSHWWALRRPASEIEWRIDYAVDPVLMANSGAEMSVLTVPPGGSLAGWLGRAGYVHEFFLGGAEQVYLTRVPPTWVQTFPAPWR